MDLLQLKQALEDSQIEKTSLSAALMNIVGAFAIFLHTT